MSNIINYEKIDEPVRGLVKLLNDNNFPTISSCQGGEGHAFPLPRIVFNDMDDNTVQELLKLLLGCDYRSFTITKCSQFQISVTPFRKYMTLEFWTLEDVIKVNTPNEQGGN